MIISNKTDSEKRSRALHLLEDVLITFGASESTELFSDTPIRMSVWLEFAGNPDFRHRLLIELNNRVRAEQAILDLRNAYRAYDEDSSPPLIAFGNIVLTSANMDDMIAAILPQTYWFRKLNPKKIIKWRKSLTQASKSTNLARLRKILADSELPSLWRFLAAWIAIRNAEEICEGKQDQRWDSIIKTCTSLLNVTSNELILNANGASPDIDEKTDLARQTHSDVRAFLRAMLEVHGAMIDRLVALQAGSGAVSTAPIWSIDLNRPAELATSHSRRTIKVDAAENVFGVSSRAIRWAIIDSGIDARHPAFAKPNAAPSKPWMERSRIVASYDFLRLLRLFENKYDKLLPKKQTDAARALVDPTNPDAPDSLEEAVLTMLHVLNHRDSEHVSASGLAEMLGDRRTMARAKDYVEDVKRRITGGQILDWPLLEPILRIHHSNDHYYSPGNGHGTHVAGILGGQLSKGELRGEGPDYDLKGMCPDIGLYDLRVCDENGQSDEFLVMAALQLVAYLNRTRERQIIHGANLSLQIQHQVRNYGCGQTPVCKEANRLVDSGVCVVAAAGNRGFNTIRTENSLVDSFAWSSIMDPGNAEKVITVGSTHRASPHTYGVSYFSSRGPTADGRRKPDLIAPGEKILAPGLKNTLKVDTGTSMSAPHVSGAAALLMARHPELIGRPDWIKEVLCKTATDLGRGHEFQGAGLVDILRALESI